MPRLCVVIALLTTTLAIVLFAWYTLQTAPETFAILVVIIALAWLAEGVWMRIRNRREVPTP